MGRGLAKGVACEVEDRRLTFAERTHRLKALDRRVGCLHRFETAHRPNQLLQLAVVGLDDVVQILDLPVLCVLRALAFGLQLGESGGIGGALSVLMISGRSQSFGPLRALARKRFAAIVFRVGER